MVHVAALSHLGWLVEAAFDKGTSLPRVITSRADLRLEPTAVVEPDLCVLRASASARTRLDDADCCVLIAEVLSPSTAVRDRGIKRKFYQRMRVPEYWIVDLDARLIERWMPADERPEILRDRLLWRDPVTGVELELDVARYFADVWGDDTPDE
jgi:Uma2 family endonuclease